MRNFILPFLAVFFLVPVCKSDDQDKEKKIAKLAKARFETATKAYTQWLKYELNTGGGFFSDMPYHLSRRLLEAQRDLDPKEENQNSAYKAHFERMVELEMVIKHRVKVGKAPAEGLLVGESFRLEAEFWLERARAKLNK